MHTHWIIKTCINIVVISTLLALTIFPSHSNFVVKASSDLRPQQTGMNVHSDVALQNSAALLAANGPLFVNPDNPRYFTDGTMMNGKYKSVLLTGSHTWCNFMDCDDISPIAATFNYTAYLDFLVARNHNFFRLWRSETARGGETGPNFWFDPMPYARSTTCCAFDGGNKFDLTTFNQAYFDRMRQRIVAARDRGIYVSIMLFDGWSVESKISTHQPWSGHPYNIANNINSIDGDTNNDNQGGETHTLSNSYITTYITPLQEFYVKKVIDTVNDLDNVLYEISNESPGNSEAWQYHMITYIKNYEATKPKKHPVGMTVEWPNGSNADLFNSPADWISMNGDINNPPVAAGAKVILADTDHLCGKCGDRKWVWKSFTHGENPLFMDQYDGAAVGRGAVVGYDPNNTNDVSLRLNLGYVRSYATRINLTAMTPRQDLCSTGYCLANPAATGAEYIVYLPAGGSVNVNLTGVQGSLSVEWFTPSTGATSNGGTVSGGATRSLTAPFSGDAALYLKSNSVSTPTSTPTAAGSPTPSRTSTRTLTPAASPSATRTSTSIPVQTASRTPTIPVASTTPTKSPTPSQTALPSATASAVTGPVASYNFNSTSGTTLTDASGYHNNGTLLNGPNWTTNGKYGSALLFDGVDDKVVVPDSNSLDLTNKLTLEVWVYPTSSMNGWDTILLKEQPPGSLVYALYVDTANNLPYGGIYANGEQILQGTSPLPLNTWSQLALSYDGATLRLYVNGQLVRSKAQTGSLPVTSGVLGIGGNNIWSDQYFSGRIDEIRIYNRALTQQEIQNDMNTPIN